MHLSLTKFFIYILILFAFLSNFKVHSLNDNRLYSEKSISNYFSGLVSSNNHNSELALDFLNDVRHLKNNHDQFNHKLVFALIQTQKISEAFSYLKKINKKNINFFEANLLLGINYFLEKKYQQSSNYFDLIIKNDKFSNFEKLIAQKLFNYIKVFENKSYDFETTSNKFPDDYSNFGKIHRAFINCYLDNENINEGFLELINPTKLNYSRYNFFYINFLLSKNRNGEVLKILEKNTNTPNTHLLLDQTLTWLQNGNINIIKEIFDCKNPNHLIAESFYLIASLYSSEENYELSNFYLNLSIYLNPNFVFNNTLLAENYFYLKDYKNSKKIFLKFNSKNQIYSWYARKRIVSIKNILEGKKSAINFLNTSFNQLENPTTENYYDLANFYKDFKEYKKAIKYYTKTLNNINHNNPLYSKILHRRGMCYERLKMWEKFENDLIKSLSLVPEEPYVLNYLAYSWLERNINIDKSIKMLEMALNNKKGDPYIIDSLGWGLYLVGRYHEAEELLQKAVELMPNDPIINDHYADVLWKLNKNLQANYFWNYVLNLEATETKIKNQIKEKLIFGIQNNS